ncbi:MAG: radical SAM/SPASM domain-containing protein [bacterium]
MEGDLVVQTEELYESYFDGSGDFDFPRRVIVEMTNDCNLSCAMCPRRYASYSVGYMGPDLYKKVIDEVAEYSDVSVTPFFRGESLLHPDFPDLIRYTRRAIRGRILLATNATLLTEDLSRLINDIGLDFVSFSLDCIDPEKYERMRVGASYEETLANIELFLQLRDGKKVPEVQVSAVETDETREGIEDFVRFWLDRVDRVRIYEEHSRNGDFGSLRERGRGERRPCLKPLTDVAVYWDGGVSLCNHDWDRKVPLGNVSGRPLAEIWRGEEYRRAREWHWRDRRSENSPCSGCDHWRASYLPGGLIGRVYTK